MPMRGLPKHASTHYFGEIDPLKLTGKELDLSNVNQGIGNIGDGTNYAQFAPDGGLSLNGTARVTNHFRIDPERLRRPLVNPPAEGRKGLFPTLDFDKSTEESVYLSDYVPFRKDPTEGIYVDITWCSDAAAVGTVVWGVEYRSIEEGEVVDGATKTITCADATAGAGKESKCVFADPIAAADIASDDDIGIRFFRKAADGADTLDEDARLLGVHLHFVSNKLGEAL